MAGLEPVTSTVTGWHSNQLSYIPAITCDTLKIKKAKKMAGMAGLEPVTSTVTGWHSNQLSYIPAITCDTFNIHAFYDLSNHFFKFFNIFLHVLSESIRNFCVDIYFTPFFPECK